MRDNTGSKERKRIRIALYAISSSTAGTFVSHDNAMQPACK